MPLLQQSLERWCTRVVRAAALIAPLIALAASGLPAQPRSAPIAFTRFADSLAKAGFSGTVLLADSQRVLLVRAMGVADRASGRAITTTDIWRWASVSKQVTAALVLRETDAGRIALDVPVSTYLPGFADNDRAGITVRHLLQHTSGLPNPDAGTSDEDGMPRVYRERGPDVGDVAYARVCRGPLLTSPGTSFSYNNCDYLVLGALLRARTGQTPSQLLSKLLGKSWTPGAKETVRGYLTKSTAEPPFELATFGSAGAFTGTVDAMLTFDRLLMGSLLSPGAKSELWRGDPKLGYAALGAWVFDAKLGSCTAPERLVERRGAIGGVQVRNVLLPTRGMVLILITNRADVEFGEVWQGRGLTYDALTAATCA